MPGNEINLAPATGLQYGAVSCDTSADRIVPSSASIMRSVLIQNISTSAATVFIGDSSVTTSTGIELVAGGSLILDFNAKVVPLYGVTAAGTASVRWMAIQ